MNLGVGTSGVALVTLGVILVASFAGVYLGAHLASKDAGSSSTAVSSTPQSSATMNSSEDQSSTASSLNATSSSGQPTVTTTSSPASTTTLVQPKPNYTASSSAGPQNLSLSLQVFTNSSGYVSIEVDEYNLLDSVNNVTATNDWPRGGIGSSTVTIGRNFQPGPSTLNPFDDCPLGGPTGLAILQGNYRQNNLTDGVPLKLYGPEGIVSCVESAYPTTHYVFSPLGDNVTGLDSRQGETWDSSSRVSYSSFGYWTGSLGMFEYPPMGNASFTPFSSSSTYTVVAADEWGRVALITFKPTGTTPVQTLTDRLCEPQGDGGVFLKVVSLQGPPIENSTLQIGHMGAIRAGDFYCGGSTFSLTGYSTSEGYVQISGLDGTAATGYYSVGGSWGGYGGIEPGPIGSNESIYATISVPSLNMTTIACYPGQACSATQATTSTCPVTSSTSTADSPETTEINISNFTQYGAPIFDPSNVTVVVGVNNTVTWTYPATPPNFGPRVEGSITWISGPACGPTFDSGPLPNGVTNSFTFTFTVPGTYVYGSLPQGGTEGRVTVEPP